MIRFKDVYLYSEPSTRLNTDEVAHYMENMVGCKVHVREEFFTHFADDMDTVAKRIAEAKVFDPRKLFVQHEPSHIEIEFEKKVLSQPSKRYLGILYDGFELQKVFNELIPEEEGSLENVHIAFTNRLVCTYGEDLRYHYRAIICGYPTIICTSGIVEAPAKPREFYLLQQYYVYMKNDNMEAVKEKFKGRFIDYDDQRLTEVVKGYVMQGLFYYISGDPFCSNKECRLLNAHWQEDLIASQIDGELCKDHKKILTDFRTMI